MHDCVEVAGERVETVSLFGRTIRASDLRLMLKSADRYEPFPRQTDRAAWSGLAEVSRQAVLKAGDAAVASDWPQLPATMLMGYARTGTRQPLEGLRHKRRRLLGDMVLAECVRGDGALMDPIVNAIWSICDEASWALPAHLGLQQAGQPLPDVTEPIVDLGSADTAEFLTWSLYLLEPALDAISPTISKRIRHEIKHRQLDPCLARDDFWWMGNTGRRLNNWTPWICTSWLITLLLVEGDESRRVEGMMRAIRCLDRFVQEYGDDGGCDEGAGYWRMAGASLFDSLGLISDATDGQLTFYDDPKLCAIGQYIYRVHVSGEWFVNFADGPARLQPAGGLIERIGKRINDPEMVRFGLWARRLFGQGGRGLGGAMIRELAHFFDTTSSEAEIATAQPPLVRDVWLSDIQVMSARDEGGSDRGLYVAAKGGHNSESHNHNDVGQFMVYRDGRPVIVDPGVGVYTASTFSKQRYENWTFQSGYHNVPMLGEYSQHHGRTFAAEDVVYKADADEASLSMELVSAYTAEADLQTWRRRVRLQRGVAVVVEDGFTFEKAVAGVALHLMTPCEVRQLEAGRLRLEAVDLPGGLRSGEMTLCYEPGVFEVEVETVAIDDARLGGVWGERLHRIVLRHPEPVRKGNWRLTFRGED